MHRRRTFLAAIAIIHFPIWIGIAQADDVPAIAAGFKAHVQNQKGGGIDWTSGDIIAEGIGKARGVRVADRLGAERAASLVAARNALAIANGIQIDANGRVGNVRNGQISLNGVVKGQHIIDKSWDRNKRPPECHIKLRVPLWGVTGVVTVFSDAQRRIAMQRAGRRLVLVESNIDVSDAVLVIDARDYKIDPCLFPAVYSSDGAVLYDIATRTDTNAGSQPPLRYVETDMTYERLRACTQDPPILESNEIQFAIVDPGQAHFSDKLNMFVSGAPKPKPANPTSRPSRRRVVVKATDPTKGKNPSQIVLTKDDAEKLQQSPEGANLLRNGKVIVVVDSAAAGMQGMLPFDGDEILASSVP